MNDRLSSLIKVEVCLHRGRRLYLRGDQDLEAGDTSATGHYGRVGANTREGERDMNWKSMDCLAFW